MKKAAIFLLAMVIGFFTSGAIDIEDFIYRRKLRRLKKESWFKKLYDNAYYFDRTHSLDMQSYLLQEGAVEKVLSDEEEKERLIAFIKGSGHLEDVN